MGYGSCKEIAIMVLLNDVNLGALGDDSQDQIKSLVKQINEQGRLISNEDRTKIIKDASGTPRILFGEGPDQFYGMKVSKEGFDVTGAADGDLVFNSDQNVFKIVDSGEWTNTTPVSPSAPGVGNYGQDTFSETVVTHNLGFVPAVVAYIDTGAGESILMPWTTFGAFSTSSAIWQTFSLLPSTTTLVFSVRTLIYGASTQSNPAGSITIKYYLLQESAS